MEKYTEPAQNVDSVEPLHTEEGLQNDLTIALNKLRDRALDGFFLEQPQVQRQVTEPYFGFSINGEEFVVSARYFCEVFTDIPIASLPNSPSILLGLVNLRGLLLPVYQLHEYLLANSPAAGWQKTSRKKCVLVIGKGERAIGLLIDALPASLSLALPAVTNQSQSQAVPHPQLPDIAQVYFMPDKTFAQLAVEQLPERLLAMASAASP